MATSSRGRCPSLPARACAAARSSAGATRTRSRRPLRSPWSRVTRRESRSEALGRYDAHLSALPGGHPRERDGLSVVPQAPALRAGCRGATHLLPLRVDGSIRHPSVGEAWEYSVVISIKNDKGEEVGRQVVGVGALQPGEGRTFSFAVEVFAPQGSVIPSWGEGTLPVGASDVVAAPSSTASAASTAARTAATPPSESRRIR